MKKKAKKTIATLLAVLFAIAFLGVFIYGGLHGWFGYSVNNIYSGGDNI